MTTKTTTAREVAAALLDECPRTPAIHAAHQRNAAQRTREIAEVRETLARLEAEQAWFGRQAEDDLREIAGIADDAGVSRRRLAIALALGETSVDRIDDVEPY